MAQYHFLSIFLAIVCASVFADLPDALGQDNPAKVGRKSRLVQAVAAVKPALVYLETTLDGHNRKLRALGILVDSNGTVVTNHSQIKGWKTIVVVLGDGRRLPGKVVFSDAVLDVAAIRVKHKKPLPHAQVADSKNVKVGDWAVASSIAFGISVDEPLTVSAVLISANVTGKKIRETVFVVDSSIGPGCGAGPLIDTNGKFIGLVTKLDRGINYAIPSNLIMDYVKQK